LRAMGSHLWAKHGLKVEEYQDFFLGARIHTKKQLKKMDDGRLNVKMSEEGKANQKEKLRKLHMRTPEEIRKDARKTALERRQDTKTTKKQILDEIKFYKEHPRQRERKRRRD